MATKHKKSQKKAALSRRTGTRAASSYTERDRLISEYELQSTQFKLREQETRRAQGEMESLANYHAGLFNSAPFGYVILDQLGVIREINDAGLELLGRPRGRVLRESLAGFVAKESLVAFLNHFRLSKSAHKPVTDELVLRVHGGGLVPVELVSAAFKSANGTTHFRTAIIDISDRRRAEDALRDTQRNYRSLVNSIEGIVWESTASGDFTFVSHQAESIIGYPAERWTRDPRFWQERIHKDDRGRVLDAHRAAAVTGKGFVIEFRMYDAERRAIWLRNSVTVTGGGRQPVKLRGVMVNITELKEKEGALREETQMLEVLNRIGTTLAGELDLPRLAAVVTDAGKEVTGAKYGAFSYKRFDGEQQQFSLHTTRGAPEGLFNRLPLPYHRAHAPVAEAEKEVVRIADTLQDARTPKPLLHARDSHKEPLMRSYLALPVVSRSGEVLGGLLFGHPRPDVFTERSQRLLVGIAAQAAVALDNARLYHAISESESHWRQLADAMPQIVWTARPDGTVDYFNRRWHEFTGHHAGRIHEDGWLSIVQSDDCPACSAAWRDAVASGRPFQTECRLREESSDHYRWHLVRAVPVRDETGRITNWFGTCTNIDEQKRAEGEVRGLNAALEKRVEERTAQLQVSNKELEAFNYSVSHDLRAPLRSIGAFSQLLEEDCRDKLDEQARDYLRIIGESTRHMSRLIDGLLHLSRISRGETRREPVDPTELAREIVARFRQSEPEREVVVVIAPDLKAAGDERLLQIALENLLNNAWKFTSKQPHARIEFGSEMQAEDRVFYVRDNGAGFDQAYAGKLFGAFMRLHTTTEFPGHGIGLAIVQRIISRHGGNIWARAAVEQGATFYFTLPMAAE